MEKRRLGNSELSIAPLVLGGNVFGWTIDEKDSFSVLDSYLDAGGNMVDTADVYSRWHTGNQGGESETIIGNWMKLRKNRKHVLIATKVGGDMGSGKNLRKDYILKAAEDSLSRLQTDYIDLYQSHWDDMNTPVEETLEAYALLVQQGKVLNIGASNYSPARLEEALHASDDKQLPRYQSFQPRYNLYDRKEFEEQYQQLCLNEEVGVICYYALASGFLTGKYRSENDFSKSARGKGMIQYLNDRGLRILSALDEVSELYGLKPSTISLAWLMSRPGITAPIASATSTTQLADLMEATKIKLDPDAMQKLNEASVY